MVYPNKDPEKTNSLESLNKQDTGLNYHHTPKKYSNRNFIFVHEFCE